MSNVRQVVIVCGVLIVVVIALYVAVTSNQTGRKQPAEIIMMTAVVPGCGNNIIENGEECDGTALAGATCMSKGFTRGVLSCTKSCLYNSTSCTDLIADNNRIPEATHESSNLTGTQSFVTGVRGILLSLVHLTQSLFR